MTASVRYDNYSDFGSATTAKASFRFMPMKNVLIRGSVGTGFHAPTRAAGQCSAATVRRDEDDYTCTPELRPWRPLWVPSASPATGSTT